MPITRPSQARLKRVFMESFSVSDIAEPLVSFDATASAVDVCTFMTERGYEVVGIRKDGVLAGYVKHEELCHGQCEDHLRPYEAAEVVPDSATLPEIVVRLNELPRVFVTAFGQVGGIVTRTDLQKAPVRMWLFGVISIIEMGLTRLIQGRFPDGNWREFVSEARLVKAETLLAERKRRNQELDLLDCLQLSDKGQIVLRNEDLRKEAGFRSRNKGEVTMKRLEALRNNLAHSQDIITCDWEIIVDITTFLDVLFET
jgi:CBS domain-containing protein